MIRFVSRHVGAMWAFARKETREVVRQPTLVLALVAGPFLVLALFGVGFRSRPPALDTVLVLPPTSELASRVDELEELLEPAINVVEVVDDEDAAMRRLEQGTIDVVVVGPEDAVGSIKRGEPATIHVVHDVLDPWDRGYISVASRVSIDELNRSLLEEVARAGQREVEQYDDALPWAVRSAESLTAALEDGDDVDASIARLELERALATLDDSVGADWSLVEGIGGGTSQNEAGVVAQLREMEVAVRGMEGEDPQAVDTARTIEAQLTDLRSRLEELTRLSPEILVRPFVAESEPLYVEEMEPTDFYAPGVLVVILQHTAVTLGALSIVRERNLGITELFRVSPLRTTDVVVGKLVGYFALAAVIGLLTTLLVVFVLAVPMIGSWAWLGGVLAAVTIASLGLGFLIASFATSEVQAVQYSMITLLFTIFFSGFVISMDRIAAYIRPLAYVAPATPGIESLHDVMFRGQAPRPWLLVFVLAYAVVGVGVSIWALRRRMRF